MSAEVECKKIFGWRFLYAMGISVGIQYLLLTVFLLFINTNFLHPIQWFAETFKSIISIYTWLYGIPLVLVMIIYSFVLAKSYLAPKHYYPTKLSLYCRVGPRKLLFFIFCAMIGFLTAWLYSRFLDDDYKSMFIKCFAGDCLNLQFMFLTYTGIYTGIYFFIKERLFVEQEVTFPIIQESKRVKIRSAFYSLLYNCLIKSFTPTICFVLLFWLFGVSLSKTFANIFNLNVNGDLDSLYSLIRNVRLILYSWILSAEILCNLHLIDILFNTLLTEPIEFEIEKNQMITQNGDSSQIILVEALTQCKLPIAQYLASLDLYNISTSSSSKRREKIFSLSLPGGHPYNWNQICTQCLVLINSFCNEITEILRELTPNAKQMELPNFPRTGKSTATNYAEKVVLQQLNESLRVRNLMSKSQSNLCYTSDVVRSPENQLTDDDGTSALLLTTINNIFDQAFNAFFNTCLIIFYMIPGFSYLFSEQKNLKLTYVLSKSKLLIWITQALAALCEKSITEDRYGVIQIELPKIIKALINLKITLDKLIGPSLNLNGTNGNVGASSTAIGIGKKIDRNYLALRNSCKRSLFRICTAFADYIHDLVDNPDDLRLSLCFINYKDV